MRLGIDLGTTRTVVVAAQDGRYPIASFDAGGAFHEWIPGACVEVGGTRLFGWEAAARAHDAPAVVRSVKRAVSGLAPDEIIEALPSRPTALTLLCEYVAHVVASVRTRSTLELGEGEALSAMVAVPANATSRQRWLTLEAFRRAGVEVLGLVNEPTAAGIEYAHRHLGLDNKRSPKRYLVVYDLGGGTFDTSAISLRGQRFELLATEGLARLGGDDLDEAILEVALAKAGLDKAALAPAVLVRCLDAARAAKESLGPHSRHALIDLAMAMPTEEPVVVPAADVVAACEPLIARTLELIDRLMAALPAHGIDPEDPRQLGAVYVVGGGASFVGVLKSLRASLGRKVQLAPVPYAATAIGLAVAADPRAEVYVQEAVTRHFGVWREAQAGREKIFDPIFGKGTLARDQGARDQGAGDGGAGDEGAELVVKRRYRPRHTVGHLRFLECSALEGDGGPSGDLTPWREVRFPYDPSLRDRQDLESATHKDASIAGEEIEETYRYDPSGSITVRIENLTHGYGRSYELGRIE